MAPDGRLVVRGLVYDGPGSPPTIEELRLDAPGPGEVLVRMLASGVCHSDLHVVDGEWSRPAGLVMGHEGAAIVEALGSGVDERPAVSPITDRGLRVGDLVALVWSAPCRRCPACRRGQPWVCAAPHGDDHRLGPGAARLGRADGSRLGAYLGVGTFCSAQVVDAASVVALDPRTPPAVAALIGCAAATGIGAVRSTANVQAGESVVVIGLGGVGMSALLAAVDRGAGPVIAVDIVEAKREAALALGATEVLAPGELAARVTALPSRGADHVLECIGLVETATLAIDATRRGGTTTLVGMTAQGQRLGLDVYAFVDGGRRLLGSAYGSADAARDFPAIADDVLSGRLPLERVIDATIAFDEVHAAFDAMRRREGGRRVVLFDG